MGSTGGHPFKGLPSRGRPGDTGVMTSIQSILVVEDDGDVRRVVERSLKLHGYNVLAAHLPEKAEEMFARHEDEVALLLTDVVMPARSGRDRYENLR